MSFTPEPVGTRFGHWTVRDHTVSNRHGMRQAVCECDCGRWAVIIMANLRTGKSASCQSCANSKIMRGTAGRNRKLTFEQVAQIKRELGPDADMVAMSQRYGVTYQCIRAIRVGKAWIGVPWPEGKSFTPRKPTRLLNVDQVREIKARLKTGETCLIIAADYGVHENTIFNIKSRRTWRHVQ